MVKKKTPTTDDDLGIGFPLDPNQKKPKQRRKAAPDPRYRRTGIKGAQTKASAYLSPQHVIDQLESLANYLEKALTKTREQLERIRSQPEDCVLPEDYFGSTVRAIDSAKENFWSVYDIYFSSRNRIYEYMASYRIDANPDAYMLPSQSKTFSSLSLDYGVEIRGNENLMGIRIPYLQKAGYINNPISTELLAYALANTTYHVEWDKCTLSFVHVYPLTTPRIPKDVDNYQYKRAIDLTCAFLSVSDGPLTFSMKMDTLLSDELPPGTYILAEPKEPEKFGKLLWDSLPNLYK